MKKVCLCLFIQTFFWSLFAHKFDVRKVYPEFALGTTGVYATIDQGKVIVQRTLKGSPADGKLKKGDHLISANNNLLDVSDKVKDPRIPLGTALDRAGATGKLVFKTQGGNVTLSVPKIGAFTKSWPLNCTKSSAIIKATAEFLIKSQRNDGAFVLDGEKNLDGLQGCLAGIFLLSTGDDKYLPYIKKQVDEVADSSLMRPETNNWNLGYRGILLAEYYLRTGDKTVLRGLEALCKRAIDVQVAGGWGHSGKVNPGYVQSGLMNSAGLPVLTTLILARECGIKVDPAGFKEALKFGFRFVGHGCVPYGDHRPELWWTNTNGRNGQLACALTLLPEEKYKKAAQHLAMLVADSCPQPEFGHTGGGFNVIWRGMSSSLVPSSKRAHYHQQLNALSWYYELSRQPEGGFSMLPTPPNNKRYCGLSWGTGAIGLTFTAPLKHLRINGGKPTKYSKIQKTPDCEYGNKADSVFLSVEHAQGFGKETMTPLETFHLLLDENSKPTAEECIKHLKHYSPLVRNWAAKRLRGMLDEKVLAALKKDLAHKDPRVRRAVFNVLCAYDGWSRPFRTTLEPEKASKVALKTILSILNNPSSAWWEIDGALLALGCCDPADIRKNLSLIWKFSKHPDWYIREASFWAIIGLGNTMTSREFLALTTIYKDSTRSYTRNSYNAGFNHLIKTHKIDLNIISDQAMRALGYTTHSPKVASGYGTIAVHEATHRTMMVVSKFDPERFKVLVPDLQKYLEKWEPYYQHSKWLIKGSKWQPGLVKVMHDLGKEGKPIRVSLEAVLKKFPTFDKQRSGKEGAELEGMIAKAIADWDKKWN